MRGSVARVLSLIYLHDKFFTFLSFYSMNLVLFLHSLAAPTRLSIPAFTHRSLLARVARVARRKLLKRPQRFVASTAAATSAFASWGV